MRIIRLYISLKIKPSLISYKRFYFDFTIMECLCSLMFFSLVELFFNIHLYYGAATHCFSTVY